MTKRLNFGFVGCGRIASAHADIVRHLGHSVEAVLATRDSLNIEAFAQKHSVVNKFDSITDFNNHCAKQVDAIIICTPFNVTEIILKDLLPLDLPMLVEKPLVLSSEKLDYYKSNFDLNNVLVAYNRRFYDFMDEIKKAIKERQLVCIDALSADPIALMIRQHGPAILDHTLLYYSAHIIDLLTSLVGRLKISSIDKVVSKKTKKYFYTVLFHSLAYNVPIQVKIFSDIPQNSQVDLYFTDAVYSICPLERLSIFKEIKMQENEGKRTYTPVVERILETDAAFKPGFLSQMKFFIKHFVYSKNHSPEAIDNIAMLTAICEALKKEVGKDCD